MRWRSKAQRALLGAFGVAALSLGVANAPAALAATASHASAQKPAYLTGGISEEDEMHMKQIAGQWPLRLIFSERKDNEFVAGVKLKVVDAKDKTVLALDDAGPMTYAKVPGGKYIVTATFHGKTEVRAADVDSKKGGDVYFHWKGKPAIDPWDGKPMGGHEVPG